MDEQRRRLGKQDTELIVNRLRELGLTVSRRIHIIHGWAGTAYVCGFYWVEHEGWRLDLAQPIVFTRRDLDSALGEIRLAMEASRDLRALHEEYKKEKTEKSWRKYQGALAAYRMRYGKQRENNEKPGRTGVHRPDDP